ncbi:MAG: 50S ribosome-binding GTPase [Nanoarchaeota archaeon]|nr:50S ribosome-binding GTPase [Nanoarchaeota archaeon]MBU1623119.1 50S ribosome-binding GTPase [Nanoarchaeota archaeon]
MPSFWKHVNKVLRDADLLIEVLDARMVQETRNFEIERKVKQLEKKLLYVVNKCDLAKKEDLEQIKKKLTPSVFISSTEHLGTTILKKKILELSKGKSVIVGVLGYPNVGKSSLINALAGKGKARTSAESGYTKGFQKIRVDQKIMLLDTPGVFPRKEKDIIKHGKTGAISYAKIKDPETAVLGLIEDKKELIVKYYQIEGNGAEEILENIALKLRKLRKKGLPDLEGTARSILKDWQTGKIKV